MIKKLVRQSAVIAAMWLCVAGAAQAAVDVNTADETALTSLKGVGPATAKNIIDERNKRGPYKDASDLAARVSGVGPKSAAKLQEAGLVFGAKAAAPVAGATGKGAKDAPQAAAKPAR